MEETQEKILKKEKIPKIKKYIISEEKKVKVIKKRKQKETEEKIIEIPKTEENKMIAYIKNMKAYYYVSLLDNGIKNIFIEEKNDKDIKLKDDFFIPFDRCGNISDSLAFFDNFKFSKFGKIKKVLYFIFLFACVMSIYFSPSVIIYYAIIYILLFFMYLYYVKNKHYLRLDVLTKDEEVLKIIYLFEEHSEKMSFFNNVKKKNDKMLSIKNNFNQVYKSNFLKRLFSK